MLLTMGGDGSIGYPYCKTSHYSSRRCNYDDEISEEEGIEVYLGEESCEYRYLDTRQYS